VRLASFVGACIVAANIVALATPAAHATLALGAFAGGQAWAPGLGVATDGTSFFIGGLAYPVPGALRPTAPFTFSVSAPTPSVLYATELDTSCGGTGAARVFYYGVVPDDAVSGHLTPITTFCVPHGIAFDGYVFGSQQIAWVAGASLPSDSTQSLRWVDLASGSTGASPLTRDLDNTLGFPQFSPSVTVAFTREVPAQSITATYHLVDLCPATLGTVLNPGGAMLANLPAPTPTAQVLDTGGGHVVARVSHLSLPGGTVDVALTDCLGAGTTTTTAPTNTTIVSTTTSTTSTTTTLPPVVTTTDPYAPGGLLEVLGRVNAGQPGPITFAIPGPGPYVIDVGFAPVFVMRPMTIDGTTQSSHGAPLVQIHHGDFDVRAAGCTVQGLAIDGSIFVELAADGTVIQSNYLGIAPDGVTRNGVGGTPVTLGTSHNVVQGNVIEGSVMIGEQSGAPPATDNVVRANRIGTNAAETALVTPSLVVVKSANNVIGGTSPGDGNVIAGGVDIGSFQTLPSSASGNVVAGNSIGIDANGAGFLGGNVVSIGVFHASHNVIGPNNVISSEVLIQGGGGNTVKGNLIGTDATGTRALVLMVGGVPYPGIQVLESSDNVIGGTAAEDRNVVAGHASTVNGLITDGILVLGNGQTPAERNTILGNLVGTDVTGTLPLPNDVGIEVANAAKGTTIGGTDAGDGNLIAFNRGPGVRISGPTDRNTVAGNRIDQNGRGIEVSNGANDGIAAPVLTHYTGGTTSTFVGHATGPPSAPLVLEFFANPAGDGEGKTFCGRKAYVADAQGAVAFSETFACAVDANETAAGTVTASDAAGNTSEFSVIPGGTTTSSTIRTSTSTTSTTLPSDPLAAVRQVLAAVRDTLVAPPQPQCTPRCRCATLPAVVQRITSLVDKVEAAAKPRPCRRALGSAQNVAKGFQNRVASLVKRACLAPQSLGPVLAQQAADLRGGIQALRKSTYCAGE